MRGAIAAMFLSCNGFIVGCSEVTEPLVEVEADPQAFPTVLRSQLPNRDRDELVRPEFRVSNCRTFPVRLTLLDQDCSCYSVSRDGKPWKVEDSIELPVAAHVTIRLEVHPSLQRDVQSWTIRTGLQSLTDDRSATRQELELTAGLRILEDIEVEPAVLEVTVPSAASPPAASQIATDQPTTGGIVAGRAVAERSSGASSEHLVTVWHTGVERPSNSVIPQPSLKNLPDWMRVVAIHPVGQRVEVEPGFVRQQWQLKLVSSPSLQAKLGHHQYRSRVVMGGPPDAPLYARNLPIVVRKVEGLMGPGQLALGGCQLGETVARRLLIRAVDDRPFRITGVEIEGQAYSIVRQPENVGPASRQSFDLLLRPRRTGYLSGRLRIETDHPDQPVWTVELQGTCEPSES